jgi:Mn2+/Fe2+ NRAMP family transporter
MPESRIEVIVGCIVMSVIAFFIIVSCAGAIYENGPKDITDATDAAEALRPFGPYAYLLFCAGLFNASLFAACILPLSTAYSVCEGLGFESGVNRRFKEAPVFYWLIALLIVVGGGVVLLPNFPLVEMILLSQVINGMLLPLVLIFMTILVNKTYLMKEWTNSRIYNFVSWTAVAVMFGLTVALVGISIQDLLKAR